MVGSVPLVDAALAEAPAHGLDVALDDPPEGLACAGGVDAVCANAGAANGTDKASASAVASGVLLNIEISSVEGPRSEIPCDDGMVCVTKDSAGWLAAPPVDGRKTVGWR